MDLSINNISFNSRYTKVSKISMDSVLFPMLKDKNANMKTLVENSGFTHNAILSWFKQSFGMSANKYFKQKELNSTKSQILDLYKKGMSPKEIAERFGNSVRWIYDQFHSMGIKASRMSLNARLNAKLPEMLKEGYTISTIAKRLECSVYKVRQWLKDNVSENIIEFRHNQNINLKHESPKTSYENKQFVEKCFAAGKSLKEVSDLLGVSATTVIRIKDKYSLMSEKDRGYELMDMFLDDMVKARDSIKVMSRLFGLSEATIARRIREVYGKNYLDIKLNK